MLQGNRRTIIDRVRELRLPAIFQWPETADLIGYGPSFIEIFRQRAGVTVKILRGAKPSDLPIEQPSKFKLVINLNTARRSTLSSPLVSRCAPIRLSNSWQNVRFRRQSGHGRLHCEMSANDAKRACPRSIP